MRGQTVTIGRGGGQEEPQVPQETSRVHIDAVAFAISAVDVGMHWTLMLPATDCFISFMSRMILFICMYTLARTYRPKYYVRLYSHMYGCTAANWQPERRNLRLCCGPGFNSHLRCGWSTDNISEYTYVFTLRTDGLRGKRTDNFKGFYPLELLLNNCGRSCMAQHKGLLHK